MGNYLEKPNEEKQTEVHTGKIPFAREVTVVECAMQGWRKTMEDQSLLEFKLNEIEELDGKCCIFGVFDGHGGSEIAEYAKNHFTKKFIEQVTALKDAENLGGEALSSDEKLAEKLGECLRKAFISLDQDIAAHFFEADGKLKPEWREPKQKDKDKEKPAPAADAPADASEGAATSGAAETNPAEDGEGLVISGIHSIDLCGTTATVLLMTEEHYIVANAGDTRCVLATDGTVVGITVDHKPKLAREVKRIESAGGTVANGRVQGLLAVSRCFGDQKLKMNKDEIQNQMVSPEPEIFIRKRKEGDEFILIACDGVFDVLSNEDACFHVRQAIERGTKGEPELKTINEGLLDECLRKQSRDNMSSILAVFPAAWEPETRIHVSARYIIEWKPEDVIRWLEAVGYGEYREKFEEVSGETLLKLDDDSLQEMVPDLKKKIGRRKKLMARVKPLRLGFLAWSVDDAIKWLGVHNLLDMTEVFREHAIDGKCLAQIDVATLKSFFRKLPITKGKVARLVKRLEDLRVRGQGGDWFSMMSIELPAPAAADASAAAAAEPAAASPATAAPVASTEPPASTGEPAAPAPAESTAPAPAT